MELERKDIGLEIRILSQLIHRGVENSATKKRVDEITGANAWIIGYIGDHKDEDVYQKDFEKQFGVTRSTASKVVNLMVQKGLIQRQSVPGDARLKKLVLTDKSWEIYEMMAKTFRILEDTLKTGFSEEELNQFFEYIHRMQKNIENGFDN